MQSEQQGHYLNQYHAISNSRISKSAVSFTLDKQFYKKAIDTTIGTCVHILSAFRFTWEKNIEGNLRVVRILKDRGLNVTYTICGDGDDLSMLKYFVRRYNLESNVQLMGRVSPQAYCEILENNSIFLQLSFSEALPASVIEAQGFGIPAIVSDAGGMPEAIVDGKTGYIVNDYDYVEAANKIMVLMNDKDLYESFSAEAIENVKTKFTVKCEIDRVMSVYDKLSPAYADVSEDIAEYEPVITEPLISELLMSRTADGQ